MGEGASARAGEQTAAEEEVVGRFARLMADRYGARVYKFGSRSRGTAREHSDYDLVAVAAAFGKQPRFRRCLDRGAMWRAAGGWRKALDLHCYTPREFRAELVGLGYLAQARARGELIPVVPADNGR